MRLSIVKTVFLKELREMLRDRRSLAVMFGLPLVLYPLVALGIASIGSSKRQELTEKPARVAAPNISAAPQLRVLMEAPDSGVELVYPRDEQTLSRQVADGKIDAVIDIPPDCERSALAGDETQLKFRIDRSRTISSFVERKLQKMADEYQKWVIEQRLSERGVPASVLTPVKRDVQDVANGEQRFGHLLAQALPVLLLMTGMLGALFPALNATTTERELGTLETLLVTPASRLELLTAKGTLVLLCGLLTAGLNMLSMTLVLLRVFTLLQEGPVNLNLSPGMLALSFVAAVPALVFFTAIVMIVGLVARNFREANAFATPVMLIPLAAMIVGMLEPPANAAMLITPVASTSVIIREVLTGRATAGQFVLAFLSSCLYAGLILSVAGRLFSSEQLVNPGWEPLSIKGLRRGGSRQPTRLPAVDEALALFCFCILLLFYASPNLLRHGPLAAVFGTQLLLILAPTLLFAALMRWDWRRTFNLRRLPPALLVAAGLVAIGLSPWAMFAAAVQEHFWPRGAGGQDQMQILLTALKQHPVLTAIGVGLLAGVCEELLFRGPIQGSMLRKLPPWAAITFAAILFSAAHFDFHGLVVRALLGMLLGWMVWRSGSVFPAMIAHALFDSTQLAMAAWQIHHPSAVADPSTLIVSGSDMVMLAVGAALAIAGMAAWRLSTASPALIPPTAAARAGAASNPPLTTKIA
jgi:sodium transport system permease protein